MQTVKYKEQIEILLRWEESAQKQKSGLKSSMIQAVVATDICLGTEIKQWKTHNISVPKSMKNLLLKFYVHRNLS